MLNLPASTEFNKRLPKQKLYEKVSLSTALKRLFVNQVDSVTWQHKIAPSTVAISPGSDVSELQVFEIALSDFKLDDAVLKQIDLAIPYHILFVLTFETSAQLRIALKNIPKEASKPIQVLRYFSSDWAPLSSFDLPFSDNSMDDLYETWIRLVAGDQLSHKEGASLLDDIDRHEKILAINKRIASLESKIRKEKQFNRQIKLSSELKQLKNELLIYGSK
jgi:hypothetical protein